VTAELVDRVRRAVAHDLLRGVSADVATLVRRALEREVSAHLARGGSPPPDLASIEERVRSSFEVLGGFAPILADPRVEEVHALGCDVVWVRVSGSPRYQVGPPVARSDEELVELVRALAESAGQARARLDHEQPITCVDLGDGIRMTAMADVVPRPCVSLCRPVLLATSLDELESVGAMEGSTRRLLGAIVRARMNVLVAGRHGAGKTTLLRALLGEAEPWERIATIEQAAELQLHRLGRVHQHVVSMVARPANIEGRGAITQRDLVERVLATARIGRLVVGEIQGPEVVPTLLAMSCGIPGAFTVHAHTPDQVWDRLGLLAAASPERLDRRTALSIAGQALDFAVFVDRQPDGRRLVTAVDEVLGWREETGHVHTTRVIGLAEDGAARPTGMPLQRLDRLVEVGLAADEFVSGGRWWSSSA
jgi:pilus assembly protein CpaF